MRKSLKIWMVMLISCAVPVKAQEKLPLKLVATTPMPGLTGDFDPDLTPIELGVLSEMLCFLGIWSGRWESNPRPKLGKL